MFPLIEPIKPGPLTRQSAALLNQYLFELSALLNAFAVDGSPLTVLRSPGQGMVIDFNALPEVVRVYDPAAPATLNIPATADGSGQFSAYIARPIDLPPAPTCWGDDADCVVIEMNGVTRLATGYYRAWPMPLMSASGLPVYAVWTASYIAGPISFGGDVVYNSDATVISQAVWSITGGSFTFGVTNAVEVAPGGQLILPTSTAGLVTYPGAAGEVVCSGKYLQQGNPGVGVFPGEWETYVPVAKMPVPWEIPVTDDEGRTTTTENLTYNVETQTFTTNVTEFNVKTPAGGNTIFQVVGTEPSEASPGTRTVTITANTFTVVSPVGVPVATVTPTGVTVTNLTVTSTATTNNLTVTGTTTLTPTAVTISSTTNNLTTPTASTVNVTVTGGTQIITGVVAPIGGGSVTQTWVNTSGNTLTFANSSGGSSTANQFITTTGGNIDVDQNQSVQLLYIPTLQKWLVIPIGATTGTVTLPVPVADGGTNANLTATGPGPLVQTSAGASVTVPSTLPLSMGGTGVALVDPNEDRLFGWADTSGLVRLMKLGTGLSYNDSTNTLTSGGTPGGSSTGLQYNNSGAFGGTWNGTSGIFFDGTTITATTGTSEWYLDGIDGFSSDAWTSGQLIAVGAGGQLQNAGSGASGTFTTVDGKTVTVNAQGRITSIV